MRGWRKLFIELSKMFLSCRLKTLSRFVVMLLSLVCYCEFIHYYLVLLRCTWPRPLPESRLPSDPTLRVMVLSDPHLLGFRDGHWFDKLRREWQMERCFQTAMTIHSPDVVFILGDLFDEGQWCSDSEFQHHVTRFKRMFRTSESSQVHVVVGNHDIGFHYMVTEHKKKRFEEAMGSSSVRVVRIKGVLFAMVDSMAMEGDGCTFCREAEDKLKQISASLSCAKDFPACSADPVFLPFSKPILMQHFPMYRDSDANCTLPDSPTGKARIQKFKQRYDCLSKSSTKNLFRWLDPRLVISGHTHHGCYRLHDNQVPEWTVSSFSWRNKKNPAFLLMLANSEAFSVKQCHMPNEETVIGMYILGSIVILIVSIMSYRSHNKTIVLSKWS